MMYSSNSMNSPESNDPFRTPKSQPTTGSMLTPPPPPQRRSVWFDEDEAPVADRRSVAAKPLPLMPELTDSAETRIYLPMRLPLKRSSFEAMEMECEGLTLSQDTTPTMDESSSHCPSLCDISCDESSCGKPGDLSCEGPPLFLSLPEDFDAPRQSGALPCHVFSLRPRSRSSEREGLSFLGRRDDLFC